MDKKELEEQLERNPVVVALGDLNKLTSAIKSPSEIIFILGGDIYNIEDVVNDIKRAGKSVFIHFDLIKGISHDEMGLRYIGEVVNPTGIISTKPSLIVKAKEYSLNTIQRVFVIDSKSLDGGIGSIQTTKPDAVEIMPGLMPEVIKKLNHKLNIPVITGGLIDKKDEVIKGLESGATSVSTSCEKIWFI
jgi:glycerol uptake operon antiterminator